MSRFHYDDYDGEGPPPEFWQQAALNAMRGRRGQIVLRELKEAILALPQPRLIEGAFSEQGEVCALGALARKRLGEGEVLDLKPVTGWEIVVRSLPELEEEFGGYGGDLYDDAFTLDLGEAMGLRRTLAWAISYENDEGTWAKETPEQRYQRILRWIDENLVDANN